MNMDQERVKRAINAIDNLVGIALQWMLAKSEIRPTFMKIFEGKESELILHYLNKWEHFNYDFAQFYLNTDESMRRKIFNYYSFPLEKDKYTDSLALNMAILKGIPRIQVFPFESYMVHIFYLIGNNNSLLYLDKIVPEALERIQKVGIDLYGNGENWSKAWQIFTTEEKEKFVQHICCQ